MRIDLNCDVGESYGDKRIGDDSSLIPLVTSVNVACGFHGGDPSTIEAAIDRAIEFDVQIGAHPAAVRDLEGFGRLPFSISTSTLASNLRYQISALQGLAKSKNATVSYVKAHGALYHRCRTDPDLATTFVKVVKSMDASLRILSARSEILDQTCVAENVVLIEEGFADRRYQSDGNLVPRSNSNATWSEPVQISNQAIAIAKQEPIITDEGRLQVTCQSICIHGDHSGALNAVRMIRARFDEEGIELKRF